MTRTGKMLAWVVALLTVAGLAASYGFDDRRESRAYAAAMTGGDPDRGRAAVTTYGCSSCHTIPGVRGADAIVGPPLTRMGGRTYVAGVLPNTPDNLVRWITDPPGVDPLTAMPNLGVTEQDARDLAAYLYTLR